MSQEDQDAILELLCRYVGIESTSIYTQFHLTISRLCHRLLTPLGTHRRSFITPSKGKRQRFRDKVKAPGSEPPAVTTPAPPAPELAVHVDVGLSKISRTLQHMSAKKDRVGQTPEDTATQYSVVFVARSGHSSAFHCHFPQMIALAARSQPPEKAVRLVGFSKSCEERLSAALGIPRASSIGLREDAPQAKGLVDFVREHVAPVRVPWLDEAGSAKFLETNIDAVPTRIGSKKLRLS